jgi:hypothetical protein
LHRPDGKKYVAQAQMLMLKMSCFSQ